MDSIRRYIHRHAAALLLAGLIFLELAFLAYDISVRRMVVFDTLHDFAYLYYFFNSMVVYHQVPLWSPFMTQGSTMAFWHCYGSGFGPLMNALILFSGWLSGVNFLDL